MDPDAAWMGVLHSLADRDLTAAAEHLDDLLSWFKMGGFETPHIGRQTARQLRDGLSLLIAEVT